LRPARARAHAIAAAGEGGGHARAGRRQALCPGCVPAARRLAVAHPVAAARGGALVRALAQRIRAVGHVGAGADAVGDQTVGVAGADCQAAAVLAAVERRVRLTGRRRAHAHAVAAERRRQHEPGAGHLLADGAGRIHVALAGAVAHTRRTARRRGLHGTLIARIGPDLRVDAGADGALARAGHARARARDVAADAVGAE